MPAREKTVEIPLLRGCVRAKLNYNPLLRLVLRGEIKGRQDDRGRWWVNAASLDSYVRDHEVRDDLQVRR
jgi:hypothetical protein